MMAAWSRSVQILKIEGVVRTNTGTRVLRKSGDTVRTGAGKAYLNLAGQGHVLLYPNSQIIARDFSETPRGCYLGRISLWGDGKLQIPPYTCPGSRLWVEMADGSVLRFIGTEVHTTQNRTIPTVGTRFGVVALEQPAMPPIAIFAGQYSRRVGGQWQAAQKAPPLTITVEQRRGGVVVLTHPDNSVCVGANCKLGALLLPPLPQIVVVEGPTGARARWLVRWPEN